MKTKTIVKFSGLDDMEKAAISENSKKIISHMVVRTGWFRAEDVDKLIDEFIDNVDNYGFIEMLKWYVPQFKNQEESFSELLEDDDEFNEFVIQVSNCLNYRDLLDYIPELADFKRVYLELGGDDKDSYEHAIADYFDNEVDFSYFTDFLKEKNLLDDFFKWYKNK